MDLDGRQLLAHIHKVTGADFLADTPITKYFVAEARRKKKGAKREAQECEDHTASN